MTAWIQWMKIVNLNSREVLKCQKVTKWHKKAYQKNMCKALNKDLEERKIDSWWQWIYNFVRNWQRKSDEAKTPSPLIFFYASLWIYWVWYLQKTLLRSQEENDISRIFFFLPQNLIFQTLSSVCMFTRLRKKMKETSGWPHAW